MTKKNVTLRDLQAIETREKIFNTANEMITELGFDKVTIEDICRRSGVAKGLFYHYFNTKADIIIETYKDLDNKYSQELMDLPPDTDPVDRIIFAVSFQARYAKEKGHEFVKQIYKHQIDTGTLFFISSERPFYKLIKEAVMDGQNHKLIRTDLSPDELTNYILSVSRGITYDWCLHRGNYDIETRMNKYFHILAGSITSQK